MKLFAAGIAIGTVVGWCLHGSSSIAHMLNVAGHGHHPPHWFI